MEELKKACEAEFAPEWLGYNARQTIWNLAWEHGHSSGLHGVRYHYDEFLDVARAVMHDQARESDAVEYVRADRIAELEAENARLRDLVIKSQWALQPFSDCVHNDNGDCTITNHSRPSALIDAHFAYKAIRAALNGKKSNGD